MTENLPRVLQNIFGENAMQGNKIAQFGSVIAGAPLYTGDIEEIQALQYWQNGWVGATFSDKRYPTSEETTGINKVITQQLKYLFQKGIPEWHIDEVYYKNSYCQVNGAVFLSLTDDNIGHNPVGDSVNWIEALKAKEQDLSISNALSTGEVKNESKLYEQILRRAHSTFDLSKFSVVGSPTISDDGILTNTSNLNCVLVNNIDLRTANIWEIDLLINIQDTDLSNNICLVFNTDNCLVFQISTDLKISSFINVGIKNINFSSNTNIIQQGSNKVKLKYDSSSGYNIFVNDIKVASDTTTSKTIANGSFYIGGGYNTLFMNEPNSIDLKSIAIWADGVPVFNGSQTGIDTIKPDDYEVVGEPTITDDGIASGFSESNYPDLIYNVDSLPSSWGCTCKCITSSLPQINSQRLINVKDSIDSNILLRININSNTNSFIITYRNLTNSYINVTYKIQPNTQYTVSIKVNGSNLTVTINDEIIVDTTNLNSSSNIQYITFGQMINGEQYWGGALDLNATKVYINGDLVYQPCLKIPYTLSKTGSKIVDAAYRDRVQDLYNQTGEALFYTLDEGNQNFTLPMDDIYGMITKNGELAEHANLATQKAYIVETYTNGRDGYIVYSNKLCQQWGYTTFNAGGTTVNYYKKFRDTNYTLLCQINPGPGVHYGQTICVTAYNSSSFTANGGNTSSLQNKNGWWQATGYIK